MRTIPKRTEERRALKMLEGMLLGIAVDGYIDDHELVTVARFLDSHSHLVHLFPFSEVLQELRGALSPSGGADEHGRGRFLQYCLNYEPAYTDAQPDDDELRELHGFLTGVVADGVINDAEMVGIARWLRRHEHLLDRFPSLHLAVLMQNVLLASSDKAKHEAELLFFCTNLAERIIEHPETTDESFENKQWACTDAPVCEPANVVCERSPIIIFPERTFCFTGRAKTGPRSKLEAIVKELGGVPKNSVSISVDFLVIGCESSPAWMFASYGRKIETAMNLRLDGHGIMIVSEADFIVAAGIDSTT